MVQEGKAQSVRLSALPLRRRSTAQAKTGYDQPAAEMVGAIGEKSQTECERREPCDS